MKLSITATLTEEQVFILAVQKWWSATINIPWQEEKVNPMSASEFIMNVYQAMIVNDATKLFTEYRTQELKEQMTKTEELVKSDVETAITSSIE